MAVQEVKTNINGADYILASQGGNDYSENIVAPDVTTELGVSATDDFGNVATTSRTLYVSSEWIAPKTDWKPSDFFNIEDYSRIVGNITCIYSIAIQLYKMFSIGKLDKEKHYDSNPRDIVSVFNTIENNLVAINDNTYGFDIGTSKTWSGNQKAPNYNDLNRIENATLKLYNALNSEYKALNTLAFTLGGTKGFKV